MERARWMTLIASAWLLGSCATVQFERDVDRAASLVDERSGLASAWDQEGELASIWDGRSPLTSDQAATLALRQNRELRAELEQIAGARADLVQAGLLPNPVLSLAFRLPLQGGNATFDADLVQQFTDVWLRPYRKGAAQAELDRVVLSASDRALRLVASVRQTHARIIATQRGLDLTTEDEQILRRSLDATEGRVRAGEATQLDVARVQQQLLGLEAVVRREAGQLDRLKRDLLLGMGMAGASVDWTARAPEPEPQRTALVDLVESDLEVRVREQRLDVAAARYLLDAKRQELSAADWRRGMPGVDVGASFEAADGDGELGPAVGLSLPIFDTGRARVEKAKAALRAEEARVQQAEQEATNQARVAFTALRRARDLATFYEEQVLTLAGSNLERAEAALRAGTADQTVLLEAQRELIEARRTLNEFRSDIAVSEEDLIYALGGWPSSRRAR
jgi:cobalt-zinc-cadmium efflux system outer membrane protein